LYHAYCLATKLHPGSEERCLTASTDLVDCTDWPDVQQAFSQERTVTIKKIGVQRHEVVYGITNVSPQRANAARLLRLCCHHWRAEATHWGARRHSMKIVRKCAAAPSLI
jgi:hypothetical protein